MALRAQFQLWLQWWPLDGAVGIARDGELAASALPLHRLVRRLVPCCRTRLVANAPSRHSHDSQGRRGSEAPTGAAVEDAEAGAMEVSVQAGSCAGSTQEDHGMMELHEQDKEGERAQMHE